MCLNYSSNLFQIYLKSSPAFQIYLKSFYSLVHISFSIILLYQTRLAHFNTCSYSSFQEPPACSFVATGSPLGLISPLSFSAESTYIQSLRCISKESKYLCIGPNLASAAPTVALQQQQKGPIVPTLSETLHKASWLFQL